MVYQESCFCGTNYKHSTRPGGQRGWLRHPEKSDGFINNLINLAAHTVTAILWQLVGQI